MVDLVKDTSSTLGMSTDVGPGSIELQLDSKGVQWQIQDFPYGVSTSKSWGIDSRGSYISKILYLEMKESALLGEGGASGTPPRSANDVV